MLSFISWFLGLLLCPLTFHFEKAQSSARMARAEEPWCSVSMHHATDVLLNRRKRVVRTIIYRV